MQLGYRTVRLLARSLDPTVALTFALTVAAAVGPARAQEAGGQTPRLQIGVEDGPEELTFGWIEDVQLDSAGNIFVIDKYAHSIPWFDRSGRFRGRIGREGEGPGEFHTPFAAAIDDENRLHVVDVGNLRISTFTVSPDRITHVGDQRLTVPAHDICTIGRRRFLLTPAGEFLIHEIDDAGRVIASFGELLEPDPQLAATFGSLPHTPLNYGRIACGPERDRIYYMSEYMGIVRAYGADGTLRWAVALPDFYRVDWRRGRSGLCCVYAGHPETQTIYMILGGTVGPDGSLRVAVAEQGWAFGDEWLDRYETRLLSGADGRQLSVHPADFVVAGNVAGRPYGFTNTPFPQVVIF